MTSSSKRMNLKFKLNLSAIILSVAISGIGVLDSKHAVVAVEEPTPLPTFPPVDIRIPIGFPDANSPTGKDSTKEPAPFPTSQPTERTSKSDNQSSVDKPIENPTLSPTDPPKHSSNWCPTHFTGNGNACDLDLPSGTSWIQCAYSISNKLETCTCAVADPFWKCKINSSSSDTSGTDTSTSSVESTTGRSDNDAETTETTEITTGLETPVDSSSTLSDDLAGPNEESDHSPTQESENSPSGSLSTDPPDESSLDQSEGLLLKPSVIPTSPPRVIPTRQPSTVHNRPLEQEPATSPPTVATMKPFSSPSASPSTSIVFSQELPPGIFTRRTSPPTDLEPTEAPTKPPTSVPSARPTSHPTITDTSSCQNASSADRRIAIFEFLKSLSGAEALNDSEQAGYMAGSWIADEDQLQVCPDDPNFTQRYVLALLYFYTSGDDWMRCTRNTTRQCNKKRFLSEFHECNWGGITCDSQNRITKINLDENNMKGSIPDELRYLEHLYELDFDSNNLVGHVPSWVGTMKHLEKLDLDRNVLSGPIPEELYSSTTLKFVDMDRNILSGTISSSIGTMSQLVFFQVDFNQLIGAIPAEISNITNLQYLSVFGNGFDESVGIPLEICGFHIQIYANCEMCKDVGDCCTVCLPENASNFY